MRETGSGGETGWDGGELGTGTETGGQEWSTGRESGQVKDTGDELQGISSREGFTASRIETDSQELEGRAAR